MIQGYHKPMYTVIEICWKWIRSSFRNSTGYGAGFTIVEILLVISITATLCGIAIPSYNHYLYKAKVARTIAEIRVMEKEVWGYQMDINSQTFEMKNENLPDTLADIDCDHILDPWGRPYRYLPYKAKGDKGKLRLDRFLVPVNTDYDLYSMGVDGITAKPLMNKASYDDILRASNGAFVGLASEF